MGQELNGILCDWNSICTFSYVLIVMSKALAQLSHLIKFDKFRVFQYLTLQPAFNFLGVWLIIRIEPSSIDFFDFYRSICEKRIVSAEVDQDVF